MLMTRSHGKGLQKVTYNTSTISPTTGANEDYFGNPAWANPTNVTANDGSYAAVICGLDGTSDSLIVSFGSSLMPANAQPLGFVVTHNRKALAANVIKDDTISLRIGGSDSGDNKADTGTYWGITEATPSYGSSTDLWGWTISDPTASIAVVHRCHNHDAGSVRTAQSDYWTLVCYYFLWEV